MGDWYKIYTLQIDSSPGLFHQVVIYIFLETFETEAVFLVVNDPSMNELWAT